MEWSICNYFEPYKFPDAISNIIMEYAYYYDHSYRHHEGCNIIKYKNENTYCNCLFNFKHNNVCKFYLEFTRIEPKKKYARTYARTRNMCDCNKNIPDIIICNKCFEPLDKCCDYKCVFCFICNCGNGHPFINLMND